LQARQRLPISVDEAWDFFATPRNLPELTPESLHFTITSELPDRMYVGLALTYTVTPLFNIPLSWMTVITAIEDGAAFSDEQRVGPYKTWQHQHLFRSVEGGMEMRDLVHYALPFDPLSRPLHDLVVLQRLQEIFAFRYKTLAQRFGTLETGVRTSGVVDDPAASFEPAPGAIVFSVV
jgi:ligand-binding SRPBCC domain-containing protein